MHHRRVELTAAATIDHASAHESTGAPRFSMIAYTGGMLDLGWGDPVYVDLAGLEIPAQKLPIRFGHDSGAGVGHTESVAVVDGRLVAEGVISRATPAAREVVEAARNGFPWQASIGASILAESRIAAGETARVNDRDISGPAIVVRSARLREISFVDAGADADTSATIAAQAAQERMMDLKSRADALIAQFPQHSAEIHAALVAGDSDERIVAAMRARIDAARDQAIRDLTAKVEERDARIVALESDLEARAARVAELEAQISALAAHRAGIPRDPGADALLSASVWNLEQFAAATPEQRIAHFRTGGTIQF